MEELWDKIPGYEDNYLITSSGKIWSLKSNNFLKPNIVRSGYKMVRLYRNGWAKDYLVHRIVAEVYCNNPDNKRVVNHKDGNKLNNYFLNLEWNTDSENQLHAIRTGLKKIRYGSRHPNSKLSEQNIEDIKTLYKSNLTLKQIAKQFNVHLGTISKIINNQSWRTI